MKWNGVNLEEALYLEKHKNSGEEEERVLQVIKQILAEDDVCDERIIARIFGSQSQIKKLNWKNLDAERVFDVAQIKTLCTRFRLRFLDSHHFKGEIPREALAKIKALQRKENVELDGYKIMAPAPMFNLEKKDSDPLLFIPLGNNKYYLIHKWGNDLSPFRKWVVWPFRSFKSLITTVALFTLTIVMAIPDSVYIGPYDKSSGAIRVIFFFYLFIAFSGLTVLYGFSRLKNFNSALWNSKYMD